MPDLKKILIIEDEKTLSDAIKKKLELEGYEAVIAYDGEEGIKKMKTEKPDLVLLDIIMPKIDGFGVLEMAYKDTELSKIPIIIISNSGQPVEIERALDLGVRDYLIKAEFDPEEVLVKVKNVFKDKIEVKNKKILIIEDDQLLLELITKKLQKEGFDIDTAVNGVIGLEKINKNRPDLILLDLVLPEMDGFEILKKIKENPDKSISQIPVIILSNLGQESDKEKGKKLGAADYLIKASVTIDEISSKVKSALSK